MQAKPRQLLCSPTTKAYRTTFRLATPRALSSQEKFASALKDVAAEGFMSNFDTLKKNGVHLAALACRAEEGFCFQSLPPAALLWLFGAQTQPLAFLYHFREHPALTV